MSYFAFSTKERYNELQKNPLFFCKYGQVSVQDEMGYNHSTEAWTSCDPTIRFMAYEKDLPKNDSGRILFVVGEQETPNGKGGEIINKNKKGSFTFDGKVIKLTSDEGWNDYFNGVMYYKHNGTNYYLTDKGEGLYLVKGSD